MKTNTARLLAVFSAGLWISLSEFVRNEFLFKHLWIQHYQNLGMGFPSDPINGAVWGLWSFVFAYLIFKLGTAFSRRETIAISWIAGFVLMWLVTGNLNVLPLSLLWFAIPLSVLEVFIADLIIRNFRARFE